MTSVGPAFKVKLNIVVSLSMLLLLSLVLTSPSVIAENAKQTTLVFNKPVDTELSQRLIRRLNKAYSAIGVEIKLIDFEHKNSLKAANSGLLDGQIGRVIDINNDFPNLIPSKTPLLSLNLLLLTNKSKCYPCKLEQLTTISHNANYPFAQKYIEQINYQGEVITHNNLASQLYMLRQNTIDGILVLEYQLNHQIDSQSLIHFDQQVVSRKPIHHYLHIKHQTILNALDKQLMQTSVSLLDHKKPK